MGNNNKKGHEKCGVTAQRAKDMLKHEQEQHDDMATHNTKLKAEGQAQRWGAEQRTGLTYKLNGCQVYNTIQFTINLRAHCKWDILMHRLIKMATREFEKRESNQMDFLCHAAQCPKSIDIHS